MDKSQRTQIHHTIKELFTTIQSTTYDKDDKKFIKCIKQNRKSANYNIENIEHRKVLILFSSFCR